MIHRDEDSLIDFYGDLGQRIVRARKAAGLTQDDLGRASGLSRSSIANIERGYQQTTLHTLLAICEATGTTLPAMLDGPAAGEAVRVSAAARAAKLTAQTVDRIEQVQRDARKLDGVLRELLADLARADGGDRP